MPERLRGFTSRRYINPLYRYLLRWLGYNVVKNIAEKFNGVSTIYHVTYDRQTTDGTAIPIAERSAKKNLQERMFTNTEIIKKSDYITCRINII